MKKINLQDFRKVLMSLAKRFPTALVFLALLTLWGTLNIWDKVSSHGVHPIGMWIWLTEQQNFIVFYYLSIATILSIVLKLWSEEVKNKRTTWTLSIITHLVLIADAIYLWTRPEENINAELVIAHCAYCAALIIAGIFLPYFREKDDLPAWNFTVRMTFFAIVCPWVCGIVSGGLTLLLQSLDWLFGIELSERWYLTLVLILAVTVASCLWMSRLPEGEKKFNRKAYTSKFLTGLIRYLLLPLLACYIVVLYCYGAKILFTLDLPKGGVCLLISVLMIGCLIMEFLLYPLQFKEEDGKSRRFEPWLTRWLPIIILPLLVLMTIAICRRISDYGITVKRLYMLTLNLWFYGVCIGLYLMRARRIHWIFLSFAALFLFTAGLPINYCNISRQTVRSRIERFMDAHEHPALPMNEKDFDGFLKSLPEKDGEQLLSEMEYLQDLYCRKDIEALVDSTVILWNSHQIYNEKDSLDYSFSKNEPFVIPDSCHQFLPVSISEAGNFRDSIAWHFECQDSLHFVIDLKHLPETTDKDYTWFIPETNNRGVLEVTELSITPWYHDTLKMDISLEGYLFEY